MKLPFLLILGSGLLLGLSSPASPNATLLEVKKIWDEAPHNAFTDLTRFNDVWVCGFREAPAHAGGVPDSQMRILTSADGESWKSAAVLKDERGDIRDAKFSLLPDGRLMMLTAIRKFDTSDFSHQSLVWFTRDLDQWDGPYDVGEPNLWLWGITWKGGTGYSIGYHTDHPRFARLYSTTDGVNFTVLVEDLQIDDPYPNESKIVFDSDGTAFCLLRAKESAHFGKAVAPYTDWTWKKLDRTVGGPALLEIPGHGLLGAGRLNNPKAETALFWISPETAEITDALTLPSGGDTSYPGLVWYEDVLWVSFYSSHEGKSSIYLAKVALQPSPNAE